MRRVVWANRSNGQLCVTIPSNSGIKEGDLVNVEKEKIKTIVYTSVTGDLFHFGHLRLLQKANELGDFHICGVDTDESIKSYKEAPVASLKERKAIISDLRCIDMVMTQEELDPTENLKKIHQQFPNVKLILIWGSNWKKVPGENYINKINGEIVKLPFYEKLSKENIAQKIVATYNSGGQ
ncbi:MAG: adenylyltransferase/cytidyltransferase family protein [Nanoarchaeota archaeon]|nr:adenylyltransferase/cytidyltransferase family protein [Nanoarchaeota archaeon]